MPYRRNDTVMREFEEMLKRLADTGNDAADAQEELADAAEQRTDAGVSGAGEGGGFLGGISGFAGGLGATIGTGRIGAGLANAGNLFSAGGNAADALETSALQQAKEWLQGNPEVLGNTIPGNVALAWSGISNAFNVAEQASSSVGNSLGELAAAGFEINDEDIDRSLSLAQERALRANEVRSRVTERAISTENIGGILGNQEQGQRLLEVLERIARNTELPGFFGGAQ